MIDRNISNVIYDLKQYQKLSLEHDDTLREMMREVVKMQSDTNRMLSILLHCLIDADIITKETYND